MNIYYSAYILLFCLLCIPAMLLIMNKSIGELTKIIFGFAFFFVMIYGVHIPTHYVKLERAAHSTNTTIKEKS